MTTDPIGLYVHIPFCIRKCNYCDFCSYPGRIGEQLSLYVGTLLKEARQYARAEKIRVNTLYFGGGTPSLLAPSEFEKILLGISDVFDISEHCELTLEANPGTFDFEKMSAYRSLGVNRISIGVQSFCKNELKKLGRIHSASEAIEGYNVVRRAGFDNVSIDLMYGIPEQTLATFGKTLDEALALDPDHISAYGLIVEEGTPFFAERDTLAVPDEDTECAMYYTAAERLAAAGYRHYEISNYAKDGHESKHNLKYWRAEEYIGLGVAAYSYFGGMRYGNARSLDAYLSAPSPVECEHLTDGDIAYEYAMMRLRLSEGISLSDYKKRFGMSFLSERESLIDKFSRHGLISQDGDRLSLTERGFYLSNTILAEIL